METVLNWIAVGVGAAGMALAALVGRDGSSEESARERWFLTISALIGVVILFLVTLPVKPPFSAGQKLGYGILIGGIIGAVAMLLFSKWGGVSKWGSSVASIGIPSAALLSVGLVLLIFGNYPQVALGGVAIGALAVAVLFRLSLSIGSAANIWAISAVGLASTVMLATFRFGLTTDRFWWRAPLMVLAAAIVSQVVGSIFAREDKSFTLPAIVASIITVGLTAVFAWKIFPNWALLWVSIYGVITLLLISWLGEIYPRSTQAAATVVVGVVALSALAFRFLGGFGIGIAILAAWPVIMSLQAFGGNLEATDADSPSARETVVYATFISVGLLVLRLFIENYASDLKTMDLLLHYSVVSLALGAIFPFLFVSYFPRISGLSIGLRTLSSVITGVFAAAAPLVILLLWGFKAEFGFVLGTVAAKMFILLMFSTVTRFQTMGFLKGALLALVAQVVALQLSGLVAPLADSPRMTKVIILSVVLVLGLIWAGVSALMQRRVAVEA